MKRKAKKMTSQEIEDMETRKQLMLHAHYKRTTGRNGSRYEYDGICPYIDLEINVTMPTEVCTPEVCESLAMSVWT